MSHTIVVGLGYGDEGKGSIVDYLSQQTNADATIRFNGGHQAAHNVVLPNGKHHTFSQFGSGTLHSVPSYLSRFCTLEPFSLYEEAEHLHELMGSNPYLLFHASKQSLVTTPLHSILNLSRESSREHKYHGTVGVGFGETISYALTHPEQSIKAEDLQHPNALLHKLNAYVEFMKDSGIPIIGDIPNLEELRDVLVRAAEPIQLVDDSDILEVIRDGSVVFEGAQGFLLDEWYGFHPHTTWSTTTPKNARTLLEEAGELGKETVVGVIRSYYTRHGAGPFPTEGMVSNAPEEMHNRSDGLQGPWRTGAFDLSLFKYAFNIVKPDLLAVTFADYLAPVMEGQEIIPPTSWVEEERLAQQEQMSKATLADPRHEVPFGSNIEFMEYLRSLNGAPEILGSFGPTNEDKTWLHFDELLW